MSLRNEFLHNEFLDVDLLVALANTGHGVEDDPDAPDELRSLTSARDWWVAVSDGPVATRFGSAADLELLRGARDLVRQTGLRNNGVDVGFGVGPGALPGLALQVGADLGLHVHGPSSPARDLAARVALALVRLPATSSAARFKACPGPDCGWVFQDTTRNGSRRWCDMAGCGNRAKAAAFRARAH